MARYEREEKGKRKFWEVEVSQTTVVHRWGHDGIAPTEAVKRFASTAEAEKVMAKMIAQYTQAGKTLDQSLDWASNELEGFMRT